MKRLNALVDGFVTGFGWGVGFLVVFAVLVNLSDTMPEKIEHSKNVECKE